MNSTMLQPTSADAEERTAHLWEAYWSGSNRDEALKALIEQYLPLVRNVVRGLAIRYYGKMTEKEMMSAGVVGLHHAIRRFVEQNENHFNRFAVCRIRGAILDELRHNDPLNRYQRKMIRRLQDTAQRFLLEHGRSPTNREIAERQQMDEATVENYLGLDEASLSLDERTQDGCCLEDVLADETSRDPRDEVDAKLKVELIRNSLRKLPERDQQLLYLRYYEELSVKEIAAVLKVTSGRVSQLYNAAIAKMRAAMTSKPDSVAPVHRTAHS